jgi:very-short-patch-repair endonuclease
MGIRLYRRVTLGAEALIRRGFEVIRLSEEQVSDEPEQVAKILGKVLASARHRVGPDGGEG